MRELQPQLARDTSTTTGPWFVSMGDSTKLSKFLEMNPAVPRDSIFVDDYKLSAYTAAGLGKIDTQASLKGKTLAPPALGGMGGWWKYLSNVMAVSPTPSETVSSQQVLESVTRVGGTFVVKGDDIVYQWNDVFPGDTPNLQDVFKATQNASS